MMRINGFVAVLVLFFATNTLFAQRFGARAVAGVNMSQITGDELAGFDKFGFVGGLQGTAELIDKLNLNVEFLYSVRGSRPGVFNNNIDRDLNVTLQYVDLPVYVSYHDWLDPTGGFYKAYALAGFSYGRLLNATVYDNSSSPGGDLESLIPFFNENDYSWLIGFGFRISRRIGLQMRYTRSINLLLDAAEHDLGTASLRPYFLTLRGEFIF